MSSSDTDLEEQLKEAGNKLLDPPSTIDELLNLLDKLESLLANVEQAPSESMKDALLPSMKALITNQLLRHAEMDVKISVTSCITEIMRITAPDAPYDDRQMKEIFQLTVAAFEKLSHVSSRCYTKAVSILDTVAKIRSCLVMLDLECDALVVQMFENFLKIIRSNHPHAVFSAMETIMTLVIDESEEISLDLLSPLLASVKKENLNVSPISWKLGEKVVSNCAVKLKDYLKEAVESMSLALDDYSQTVAAICQSEPNPFKQEHPNDQAKENKLGKMTDPKELARMDLNDSVQLNQGPIPNTVSPTEVGQSVDGTLKSVMSNCTNEDTYKSENSSKRLRRSHVTKHSKGIGASNGEPGKLDTVRAIKTDEPASVPKKRGRKPNSLMNPEEGYDHSWISSGRKTPNVRERKSHDKGFDDSASANLDPEKATLLTLGKATEHSDSQSKSNLIPADFPSPNGSLPDGSRAKRGRPKKKENLAADPNSLSRSKGDSLDVQAEEKASADLCLKKESEVTCNSDAKPLGRPRRIRIATKTNEETTVAPGVVLDKEAPVACLPEEKPMRPSTMNAGMVNVNDRLLLETSAKKRKREHTTSEKDDTEASGYEILSKSGTKSNRKDGSYLQETPKTKARRKRTTADEGSSVNPGLGEELVGSRIKVWWPLDKMFYEGVVNFYDPIKKKHQVLYADGDEEILNLRKERWQLVGDKILPEDQETDLPEPDASSNITQKRKRKTKSESAKQEKGNAASKRGGGSRSISKVGRTKSGGSSADDPRHDQAAVHESQGTPCLTNDGSKDDGSPKSTGKLSIGRPKTGSSLRPSMPKTTTLPKGFL